MKKNVENKMIFSFLPVIFLIINVFASVCVSKNESQVDKKVFFDDSSNDISVTILIDAYEIKNSEKGQKIFVENFGCLSQGNRSLIQKYSPLRKLK